MTAIATFMAASKTRMAAWKASCDLHGPDGDYWAPRMCFAPPPDDAVRLATSLLSEAADAAMAGDIAAAATSVRAAELPELLAWGIPIMATVAPHIVRWRPVDIDAFPPEGRVGRRDATSAMKDAMYRRDGWRCRFCGCRVVRPEARTRLHRLLPGAFRWTPPAGVYGDHAGFYVLSGVADHVQPHSRGGQTALENLVTCCQPCNYGRGPDFLEPIGLSDPRLREPFPADGWDGLERVLALPEPIKGVDVIPDPPPNREVWSVVADIVTVRFFGGPHGNPESVTTEALRVG